jgi:photoactive yellow protein
MNAISLTACAWCGRTIREVSAGSGGAYGICLTCLGDQFNHPLENVTTLGHRTADKLPFGFIRLDAEGNVVAYNTAESALSGLPRQGVLGRNFFRQIAPCTCVDEFEGMLSEMMKGTKAERKQIEFLFKFKTNAVMVSIVMISDPRAGYATLLIRKLGEDLQ